MECMGGCLSVRLDASESSDGYEHEYIFVDGARELECASREERRRRLSDVRARSSVEEIERGEIDH